MKRFLITDNCAFARAGGDVYKHPTWELFAVEAGV